MKDIEKKELLDTVLWKLKMKNPKLTFYKSEKQEPWCIAVDEQNRLANIYVNFYGELCFVSVHKPNKDIGTGFLCDSIEEAFRIAPSWVDGDGCRLVRKYKDIGEYQKLYATWGLEVYKPAIKKSK